MSYGGGRLSPPVLRAGNSKWRSTQTTRGYELNAIGSVGREA